MKRFALILLALSFLCAPANAQSFLNKLKEKAEQAIGNVAEGIIPENMNQASGDEESYIDDDSEGMDVASGKQTLPAKRSSRFGWDSPITPSTSSDPAKLFSEFPAVPSAAELANPTEEAQIAYYNAIKAVTLRAEELNLSNTCKDSETIAYRDKADQMLKDAFGLTDAEIRALEDPDTSEEEKSRISDKIAKALLGDLDPEAISGQLEGKSEEEIARDMSSLSDLMGSVANIQNKMAPIMEYNQKASSYAQQLMSLTKYPDNEASSKFSASDKEKVQSIKDRIYKTPDASVYNPLYLEALQLIASYRERASKVWAAEVQKNFNTLKGNLSSLVSLNRKAVSDEIIPECAALRAPYNLIIQAGDILSDAYKEFPADYPVMYLEEVIKVVEIEGPGFSGAADADADAEDDSFYIWWPEFSVFSNADYDSIASGNHIYASGGGTSIYHYNGGGWTALSEEELKSLNAKKKDASAPKSMSWKSKDGKRTVFYNAEGGFIQLPEGDQAYPMVLKWSDDAIQWLCTKIAKSANGKNEYQIIQCTYKL